MKSKKMKSSPKNTHDSRKIVLIASLTLNAVFIVGIIVSAIMISTAGTNSYSLSILNHTEQYIQNQYCNGQGYQKLMQDVAKSLPSGSSAIKIKANQALVSKEICGL